MSWFNLSFVGQAASAVASALGNTTPGQVSTIAQSLQNLLNPNATKADTMIAQAITFANMGNQQETNSLIDAIIALGVSQTVASTLAAVKSAPPSAVVGLLMSAKTMIDSNM